jgi:hypothetical protein
MIPHHRMFMDCVYSLVIIILRLLEVVSILTFSSPPKQIQHFSFLEVGTSFFYFENYTSCVLTDSDL